jgi:nitrate reductase assembly molybdenum cofactor insertion protein NarJ
MTQVYKVLSVLLEYPTKDLVRHWHELTEAVNELPNLSTKDRSALTNFINWASDLSLTQFQAEYVNVFDMTAENSLYLTYHLFDNGVRHFITDMPSKQVGACAQRAMWRFSLGNCFLRTAKLVW